MQKISVVISTYNRPELLVRAVQSCLEQEGLENVVIVDDCSTVPLPVFQDPRVVVKRMHVNGGPGPARNVGIMSVSSDWVVILDDDDFFFPDALSTLSGMIEKNPHLSDFPVFQISHENGKLNEAYRVVKFDDYLEGLLKGDFLPVIRRDLFVRRGYRYPESRVGGESLLWWKIALAEGIPSYQVQPLCKLGSDAPVRLTSAATQISHASAHQQLAAEVIGSYGGILSARYPNQLRKRKAAFCTYGLLAGDGKGVRRFIRSEGRLTRQMCVFFVASFVPSLLLKSVFRTYRFTQDLRA